MKKKTTHLLPRLDFLLFVSMLFSTYLFPTYFFTACADDGITLQGVPKVDPELRQDRFLNPSVSFRPIALFHFNGALTNENVVRQLTDLKKSGFGSYPARNGDNKIRELTITTAKDLGMLVMGRDGTGYPSGGASGRMEKLYPQHLRKVLEKTEAQASGNPYWKGFIPQGKLMAAVAMNMETKERIDLSPFINNNLLSWQVPTTGNWRVMFFTCVMASFWKKDMPVDYLDPVALSKFREIEYDEFAEQNTAYLRNPIVWTQYDDVGFLLLERSWTNAFNEKFKEINGYDPTLYYPALWYNIGPDTQAARVAFFNTRAELLAEGLPKTVKEWTTKHKLTSVGQPPGNYKNQPVDILGDAFKFFRHVDIPQTDAIISYGNGLHGFKLTSSAADFYDRPVVMTEAYGAFPEETVDVKMLYRVASELFARGGNFVMVHYGFWNHPDPRNMPYKIMGYPEEIGREFPAYNAFVGRACYLLTGGRTVANVALLYPIDSLEAGFYFDAPEYQGRLKRGWWTYPEADYLEISGLLTNQIRRDFTFVHPEYLATDKYSLKSEKLRLNTKNFQEYDIVIIPGGSVIRLEALKKIKQFYDNGGKVIATSLLPSMSAELDKNLKNKNKEVNAIVDHIFGANAATNPTLQSNKKGGKALFIPKPDSQQLSSAMDIMSPQGDVIFANPPRPTSKLGMFSYIHKVRDEKNIYFFANSSDDVIDTDVYLRGKMTLENWNPYDGSVTALKDISYVERGGQTYTKIHLTLSAVRSTFWVGKELVGE